MFLRVSSLAGAGIERGGPGWSVTKMSAFARWIREHGSEPRAQPSERGATKRCAFPLRNQNETSPRVPGVTNASLARVNPTSLSHGHETWACRARFAPLGSAGIAMRVRGVAIVARALR